MTAQIIELRPYIGSPTQVAAAIGLIDDAINTLREILITRPELVVANEDYILTRMEDLSELLDAMRFGKLGRIWK